jgi:hypothetical protein
MLLQPLKRVPVADSTTAEMVEPSAGTANAFVTKLRELPQDGNERVLGHYFSGLRVLICLYDHGKPFLAQLVNTLHSENGEAWPLEVQEGVSIRQTLDDLDTPYLCRVIDYFLDALNVNAMEELNTIIRTQLWVERDVKN